MRIRELHIEGFGHFANREWGPFDRPVTVFHGPNEAGKSTLLEFVRRVLFGFPRGRSRDNRYPPLSGGRHGGRVTILSDAGETFTVQRFQGKGSGPITLTAASGETLPDIELPRLLGHHSKDVFQNVFAFTLDEVHNDALLKDDSVSGQLYSAGMGAARLPDAMKTLDDDKSGLFLKGGRKHAIYRAAESLDQVDAQLQNVSDNAAEYGRLSARLEEIKVELKQLNGRRRECQSQLDHQRRLESAWDDWNDLVTAERQLAELPVTREFPADGVKRLEALEERVRNTRRECESAGEGVTEAESNTEARVEHEAVLTHSDAIRGLERGRTSFAGSVHDLPERVAELEGYEHRLAETLKDLGPDWDEARLENVDLSIAVREEVAQYQERLREAAEELARRESALAQNATALEEATGAETHTELKIKAASKPSLVDERIRQRRTLIRTAGSRLGQVKSARERVSVLQHQLDSLTGPAAPVSRKNGNKALSAASVLAGIALLVVGAMLGSPALPVGIAAGLAFVVMAAYLFASGHSSSGADAESPLAAPTRESLGQAEYELTKLRSALGQDTTPLGLETIDETALVEAEGLLDEEQARLSAWTRLSEELARAKALAKQRTRGTERSREAVEEAGEQLEAARREWREWLRARSLRETFLPETVAELRGKVDLGLTQLGALRDHRRRIGAIQKDIDEYTDIVEPLALDFAIAFDKDDPRTVAAATDRLVEMYADVERRVRDRADAEADLKKAKRQLEERRRDLWKAEEEMNGLLQSGGAADAEDFRNRAELHLQRADLEEKRRASRARLQRLSGPGARLEALKKMLGETDAQAISAKVSLAEEERDAVADEINRLSIERGAIESDLKKLTGEEDASKLRVERHRLLEEMRGHARQWAVRTVAENLLREARGKFERERQPDVIRHSQEFFHGITGGRYKTVFSPLGSSEIHVTDSEDSSKDPTQLSRGTREQLFLSLRFGLIRELGQRSERLPVIVDEVLVNFDPRRGMMAAKAFVDLAQTNQVLVFTCHPQIVEWFVSAAAKSNEQEPAVIEI